MQDKIRSEYTDWELLKESEENQVYRCFELVGIYKLYNELYWNENNFEEFYLKCKGERRYCYRNNGVRIIHGKLEKGYDGFRGKYNISKRSMRQYGKTYFGEPVVVYESSFIVLNVMLDTILHDEKMREIYHKFIHKNELKQYLEFQYVCLTNFIKAGGTRKKDYYNDIKEKMCELISKVNEV